MRPLASLTAVLLLVLGALPAAEQTAAIQSVSRERISINDGWRFAKRDPPGSTGGLQYDVRPEVGEERDDRPADDEPRPPEAVDRGTVTLKAWILPTGNPYIKDPSLRPTRIQIKSTYESRTT